MARGGEGGRGGDGRWRGGLRGSEGAGVVFSRLHPLRSRRPRPPASPRSAPGGYSALQNSRDSHEMSTHGILTSDLLELYYTVIFSQGGTQTQNDSTEKGVLRLRKHVSGSENALGIAKTLWESSALFAKAKKPFQQAHKRSGPYRDLAIGLAPDKGQRLGRGHGSVAVPELAPCLEALARVWSPFSYLQKCVSGVCKRVLGFTKALFERKTHFPKARFAFLSHLE